MNRVIVCIAMLYLPAVQVDAGDCAVGRSPVKVVKARSFVAVKPVQLFFVGAPVRVEALVAQRLAADPIYQELQKFKAHQASQQSQAAESSLVRQHCARCHGGGAAQGGFSIEGMNDRERLEAMQRLMHPDAALRMPKGAALTDSERGAVMQELLQIQR